MTQQQEHDGDMMPICMSCWHCFEHQPDYERSHVLLEVDGNNAGHEGIMPKVGLVGSRPVQPYDPSTPLMQGSVFSNMERPKSHTSKTWKDGSRYEGQWKDGKANEYGRLRHADGDEYEGQWKAGMAHGQGTYKAVDGTIYRGQWGEDVKEGQGVEMWPDGARYEGHYSKGRKHGDGTFVWPHGSSYFGQFLEDEFDGEGSYHAGDGRHYSGNWKKGQMCGQGCYRFPDGRVFEGQYRDGLRHGYGTFIWEDGRRYEGQWEKDQEHGKGIWISPKGERKEGTWKRENIATWDKAKPGKPGVDDTAGSSKPGSTAAEETANNRGGYGGAASNPPGKQNDEPASSPESVYAAFKEAVTSQMDDYKNNRRMQLVSAISGAKLKFEEAVVQHAPVGIETLVDDFVKEQHPPLRIPQVRVQRNRTAGIPGTNYVLEDQALLQRWLMYHLVHAHYRVISIAEAKQY